MHNNGARPHYRTSTYVHMGQNGRVRADRRVSAYPYATR